MTSAAKAQIGWNPSGPKNGHDGRTVFFQSPFLEAPCEIWGLYGPFFRDFLPIGEVFPHNGQDFRCDLDYGWHG